MHYAPPEHRSFKRALRQAHRIKHAKNKKYAVHTLYRRIKTMLGC